MGIRWKLTSYYLIVVAVVVMVMGAFFIWFFEYFYMENLRENLINKSRLASGFAGELFARDAGEDEIDQFCKDFGAKLDVRFTIIDYDGRVLGDSLETPGLMENHAGRPEFQEALQNVSGSAVRYSSTLDKEMYYVAYPIFVDYFDRDTDAKEIVSVVRIALPLSQIKSAIGRIQAFTVTILILSGIAAVFIGNILSRRITIPLAKLNNAAVKIAEGSFEPELNIKGNDELASLAGTITDMGLKLRDNLQETIMEKNKVETVVNSINSGIILFDSDQKIEIINPAAEKMFDLKRDRAIGGSARALLRYQILIDNLESVSREGGVASFEMVIFYPNQITVQTSLLPISNDQGKVMGVLAVFTDITKLLSLEKMRSEFAANVAHELRTPLTSIRGYSETLLEINENKDKETGEFTAIIAREAKRLSALIDSLLDLSKIESSKGIVKKQLVDLPLLVKDTVNDLSELALNKKITIRQDISAETVLIQGNPEWLRQALFNVLENAVSHNYNGGEVTVKTVVEKDNVELTVSDNGPGIPASDLPRVFERFYRVDKARSKKMGGTGLGLSIVRHILDAHGAEYGIDSAEGKGTVFRLVMPVFKQNHL